MHEDAAHQNGERAGAGDWWIGADSVLDCESAEAVIVALKGIRSPRESIVYSDRYADDLAVGLAALGIPVAEVAPDELSMA